MEGCTSMQNVCETGGFLPPDQLSGYNKVLAGEIAPSQNYVARSISGNGVSLRL